MLVKPRRRPPGFPIVPGTSSRFPKLPVVVAAPATPELPKPRRRPPEITKVCHQPDMRMQLGGAAPACPAPIPVVLANAQPMVAHAAAAEGSMPWMCKPPRLLLQPGSHADEEHCHSNPLFSAHASAADMPSYT
ncbi:hypothetical protein WJX74_007446 [Apatococcus lobatus]|uniref:Uncharacterized protein n=1 Tax=Apatococcus lobatus TaxID=904363 RepID=A0AAW1RYT1_9CHLO